MSVLCIEEKRPCYQDNGLDTYNLVYMLLTTNTFTQNQKNIESMFQKEQRWLHATQTPTLQKQIASTCLNRAMQRSLQRSQHQNLNLFLSKSSGEMSSLWGYYTLEPYMESTAYSTLNFSPGCFVSFNVTLILTFGNFLDKYKSLIQLVFYKLIRWVLNKSF